MARRRWATRAGGRARRWLSLVGGVALVGAALVVGPGASPSGAATTEVVGCSSNGTATATDLQNFQQDIVTLDGSGGGTITLTANCTYSFTAAYGMSGPLTSWYGPEAFPAITSAITIDGQGAIIQRDPRRPRSSGCSTSAPIPRTPTPSAMPRPVRAT